LEGVDIAERDAVDLELFADAVCGAKYFVISYEALDGRVRTVGRIEVARNIVPAADGKDPIQAKQQ
jgi:hypothetical protein